MDRCQLPPSHFVRCNFCGAAQAEHQSAEDLLVAEECQKNFKNALAAQSAEIGALEQAEAALKVRPTYIGVLAHLA